MRGRGRTLRRTLGALAHDTAMAGLGYLLSLFLRLGTDIVDYPSQPIWLGLAIFVPVAAVVFRIFRLDRMVWRYASLGDVQRILAAVAVANLAFLATLFLVTRLADFPRSAVVINLFVLTALLAGPRLLYRLWQDREIEALLERDAAERVPVLLIGAGDGTDLFIREMARGREAPYRVVGIVDDRGTRIGRRIRGVEVMGGLDDLPEVVARLAAAGTAPLRLVLTRSEVAGADVRRLLDRAEGLGLPLSRMPRVAALDRAVAEPTLGGRLEVRPLDVGDLLGRPQAQLDREAMARLIAGRRVLVTGAGGTIGSELARQVAALAPSRLALLDASEYALYQIDLELAESQPALPRTALLGDVRDRARVERAMADERPELVFHAAACKHVPLVELNPEDGLLTNVIGTRNVAEAARAHGVGLVVLISTDKAVNPTNVMGASKRVAEALCQALDLDRGDGAGEGRTRFRAVRFGNVLGSTGSVVPLFQRQLARGGPLTVTHPEVTRYFMTVREAVELVLQASALDDPRLTQGGALCVLDMGEPVRIVDLARQMIRLAGYVPDRDVAIAFTGLRPGEKLHEELFHAAEPLLATGARGVLLAAPRPASLATLRTGIAALEAACRERRTADALAELARLVPEWRREPHATRAAD